MSAAGAPEAEPPATALRAAAPASPDPSAPVTPPRADTTAAPFSTLEGRRLAPAASPPPPRALGEMSPRAIATTGAAPAESPSVLAALGESRLAGETVSVEGGNRLATAQAARDPASGPAAQVAAAIRTSGFAPGETRIEVSLSPPELGRVVVLLDIADDAIRAVLTAERDDAGALLRRHGEVLIRDLRAAGFADVRLSHGALDGDSGGDTHRGAAQRGGAEGTQHSTPDTPAPANVRAIRIAADGALDLRI